MSNDTYNLLMSYLSKIEGALEDIRVYSESKGMSPKTGDWPSV